MAEAETTSGAPSGAMVLIGRIALVGAICVAVYLAIASIRGGGLAGCGEGGGCHEVLASKWSSLLGIPVSILGLFSYLALLVANVLSMPRKVHVFLGALILGAAVWFVVIQAVILKSFCPWCCTTHALACVGAVLLVWIGWPKEAPVPEAKTKKEKRAAAKVAAASKSVKSWAIAGGLAVVVTAVAQILSPDKETTLGVKLDGGVSGTGGGGHREISLHGGKFKIDTKEYPVMGSIEKAQELAIGIFDFTCPHCEKLQALFDKVLPEYEDRIAVVKLPGAHKEAGREIHRMMLAAWKEDPEIYKAAAKELRTSFEKPSVDEVKVVLVGHMELDELEAAMEKHRAWADERLAFAESLVQEHARLNKRTTFPQLMLGSHLEFGNNVNPGHYYQLFEDHLGMKRSGAPTLLAEPSNIDLGDIIAGGETDFELVLRNPGTKPLVVSDIKVPLGLRVVMPDAKAKPWTVAAGGTQNVKIHVRLPDRNEKLAGEFYVFSDAGATKIVVAANVRRPYNIVPASVNFGNVSGALPAPIDVTLTFDEPMALGDPVGLPGKFSASISEVEPGRKFVAKVIPEFDLTLAKIHSGRIMIPLRPQNAKTGWPPNLYVPVRARVTK